MSFLPGIAPPASGGQHRGVPGRRDCPPEDTIAVDTTMGEYSLGRLIAADPEWAGHTLSSITAFPAGALAKPLTTHVAQWLSRPSVNIPSESVPVVENRIMQSASAQDKGDSSNDWLLGTPRQHRCISPTPDPRRMASEHALCLLYCEVVALLLLAQGSPYLLWLSVNLPNAQTTTRSRYQ